MIRPYFHVKIHVYYENPPGTRACLFTHFERTTALGHKVALGNGLFREWRAAVFEPRTQAAGAAAMACSV
jgi:hypothetical protein